MENFQVVLEVGNERGLEILGVELFGLVIVNQPLNGFLIVGLQQSKTLEMCFLLMKTWPLSNSAMTRS